MEKLECRGVKRVIVPCITFILMAQILCPQTPSLTSISTTSEMLYSSVKRVNFVKKALRSYHLFNYFKMLA